MSRRPVRRGSAPEDWKPGPRGRFGGVAQRLRRRPAQGVAPTDARADRPLGNPSSHRRPPDGFAGRMASRGQMASRGHGFVKPRLRPREAPPDHAKARRVENPGATSEPTTEKRNSTPYQWTI